MSHRKAFLTQLTVGIVASAIATATTIWVTGPASWVSALGWTIFFLSLQSSLILDAARRGRVDACTRWLLRL